MQLGGLEVGHELHLREVSLRSRHHFFDEQVETDVLGLLRLRLAARELDELGYERGHLGELADDVVEQLLPLVVRHVPVPSEHLDVRAQAGQRRSQLVRGIRDELSLGAVGLLERREHCVEARSQPAELVLAGSLDPLGEIAGFGHLLGRPGQPANRRKRRLGDHEAEAAGDSDSPSRNQDQENRYSAQRVVDLAERSRDLQCVLVAVLVLDRNREDPYFLAADARVAKA